MKALGVVRDIWIVLQDSRRSGRYMKVWKPLFSLAYSNVSEAAAAERLRPIVQGDPVAARYARTAVKREHADSGGYITDRATRILNDAMGLPPLPPPSAERRATYTRERSLGAKPLREAFAQLAADVPALRSLETATTAQDDPGGERDHRLEISERCSELLGPDAQTPDPLLRSDLAITIAVRYLFAVNGGSSQTGLDEAILDRPPAGQAAA